MAHGLVHPPYQHHHVVASSAPVAEDRQSEPEGSHAGEHQSPPTPTNEDHEVECCRADAAMAAPARQARQHGGTTAEPPSATP